MDPMTLIKVAWNPCTVVIDRLERGGCNSYCPSDYGSGNCKWVEERVAVIAGIGVRRTDRNNDKNKKSCPDTC